MAAPTLRVSFELDDSDLDHFRAMLRKAQKSSVGQDSILEGAGKLIRTARSATVPDFVKDRIDTLAMMVAMVRDSEWGLGPKDSSRVSAALAYFAETEDLVPDHVPGLGFLDDAVMIELISRELKHEIDSYQDFCRFRSEEESKRERGGRGGAVTREEWLRAKRKDLQARMHRRRRASSWRSLFGRASR